MTKFFIGLIFISINIQINAQDTRLMQRTSEEIYKETDLLLKGQSMEVPVEYEDASAVALAVISSEYFVANKRKRVRTSYYRTLLKINDRAARDKFSTFSFNNITFSFFNSKDEKIFVLRIIKPSGEKIDLEIETLEKNADDAVALPNLEIGDILDFGLKVVERQGAYYCFSPQIKTLNTDFPIVYGHHRYNTGELFYINYLGLNGAPELLKNDSLSEKNTYVYDLQYSNLDPVTGETWAPKTKTQKTIKFQICYYSEASTYKAPMMLGDPNVVKSSSTDNEKVRAIRRAFTFYKAEEELTLYNRVSFSQKTDYFKTWYNLNFTHGSELSNVEYMNYAFYHFRYYSLIFNPLKRSYIHRYEDQELDNKEFVRLMRYAADYKEIPFDVVFCSDREISSFDDVLLMSEFSHMIRYATESGEWKYMEHPRSYQSSSYFNPSFHGQEAMVLGKNHSFSKATIPHTKYGDNLYRINFIIDPDLESKSSSIESTSTTTGNFKYQVSRNALSGVEFHEDAMKAMLPKGQSDAMIERNRLQRKMDETEEIVKQDPKDKLNEMKMLISKDFEVEEYIAFEIINSGVISDSDSLIYRENYTIKDVVEKAGQSYLINLSKISLDQISFTDEEIARRINNIYIDYPKTYEYLYHINIPEGYKAYGLDAFKESVDSKYGSVEMHAEELDNQVVVYLKKVYKESFIPKEEWGAMMEFLGPAMKLNDARLVLKKE